MALVSAEVFDPWKVCRLLQVHAEDAQRVLKDLIFQTWADGVCESRADTLKMARIISNAWIKTSAET